MVKNSILAIMFIVLTACANGSYKLGNITRSYCTTENKEIRALLKATLTSNGINVGVDYCTVYGFAKAVNSG